jgi:hypothetical protein
MTLSQIPTRSATVRGIKLLWVCSFQKKTLESVIICIMCGYLNSAAWEVETIWGYPIDRCKQEYQMELCCFCMHFLIEKALFRALELSSTLYICQVLLHSIAHHDLWWWNETPTTWVYNAAYSTEHVHGGTYLESMQHMAPMGGLEQKVSTSFRV